MNDEIELDIYTYRKLPWISKSTILAYRFCEFLFKLRHFQNVDVGTNKAMETGTNLHAKYAEFFEKLDYARLKSILIENDKPIDQTKVYKEIYGTIMGLIPPNSRAYEPYQIMVRNFALIETAHWIDLNNKFKGSYPEIIKFFVPKLIEKYTETPSIKIFGTIDRGSLYEEDENITILYDYKTGWVPIAIVEERDKKPGDSFSWKLQSKRNLELHFYIILDMTRKGYVINPELVDFCMNEENFVEDVKVPKVNHYFYDKHGDSADFKKLYRVGIIYTGYKERPIVPKIKPNKTSMKTTFKWINKIRTVIKVGGPYSKKPSYFKCRNCNETIMDMCLGEEERKMIFFAEKDD